MLHYTLVLYVLLTNGDVDEYYLDKNLSYEDCTAIVQIAERENLVCRVELSDEPR